MVLLKDTSAATGQAGIQTHILITPELESNARDRSATTLRRQLQRLMHQLMSNATANSLFIALNDADFHHGPGVIDLFLSRLRDSGIIFQL